MWKTVLAAVIAAAAVTSAGVARADLIYDNGPMNWDGAASINGYRVTNSFEVSSDSTLTSATIGLWIRADDIPLTATWSIGTTPFGDEIASGTSALANVSEPSPSWLADDVYHSSFAIDGDVTVGAYWFTLSQITTAGGGYVGWALSDGPSTAYQRDTTTPTTSQDFQLYGTSAVPEPATWALLGLGLLGVPLLRRRGRAG